MRCRSIVVLAALASASWAGVAAAQTTPQVPIDDLFNRTRDIAVLDRQHPDFAPQGLPLGAFRAFPVLEIDGAHNSNVLVPAYPQNPRADWFMTLNPTLDIQSQWSRNLIKLDAGYEDTNYAAITSENGEQHWGSGEARYDIGRNSYVGAVARFSHNMEPRTDTGSPEFAAVPVRFDVTNYSGYYSLEDNRLMMSGRADFFHIKYFDAEKIGGGTIPQFQRDRDVWQLMDRVEYALSPASALVVQGNYLFAKYPFNPTTQQYNVLCQIPHACNQDTHGFTVQGGVNFEATALVRGELTAGYLRETYVGAAFPAFSGIAYSAQLEFFPSEITTISATAARTPEQSALPGTGGYIQSKVEMRLDHEFFPDLVTSTGVWYAHDVYKDITRSENFLTGYFRETYYMNQRMRLEFRYDHLKHDYTGLGFGRDYDVNQFTLGVHFQE